MIHELVILDCDVSIVSTVILASRLRLKFEAYYETCSSLIFSRYKTKSIINYSESLREVDSSNIELAEIVPLVSVVCRLNVRVESSAYLNIAGRVRLSLSGTVVKYTVDVVTEVVLRSLNIDNGYNINLLTVVEIELGRKSILFRLLVVSIASDLVTMVGENRVLAHYGLKVLNENPRKGLLALITLSNLEPGHITVDDIVFKIGPRINAAGRMETGRLAVDLLKSTELAEAMSIGEKINANNNERKNIDKEITCEAIEMVRTGKCLAGKNATIVYNPKWNKGVVGIVASRLVEAFYKPTVVLTKSNGFVTGSARSISGFDLYEAIESCSDLLENFGGHVYAAGLTMKEENLAEFARRMDEFIAGKVTDEMLTPVIDVDVKLDFAQITPKFFRILKQFQPFGPGNTNPIFVTENVYDAGNGRKVGADGVHMKLDLIQESQPYHQIAAIAFNMAHFYDYIKEGNPFDVCYAIVENYYRGSSSLQLRVRDIREREDII